MNPEEATAIIRELMQAEDQEKLQSLIAHHLPRLDNAFFGVLTQAAQLESARNPAIGAKLTALLRVLLPLRTLI